MMKNKSLNLIDIAREYSDDEKARVLIESMRWAGGRKCPHCQNEKTYELQGKPGSANPVKPGTYKCSACRKKFTVRVGTIFEDSHIPLGKWLMTIFLMCSSKKAMSANQIHRMVGVTYKSAWFMCHRIRHGMKPDGNEPLLSGIVEIDETYVGGKPRRGKKYDVFNKPRTGRGTQKAPVVALVERDGSVRTSVMPRVTAKNLRAVMKDNIDPSAEIHTDEHSSYPLATKGFKAHRSVNHGRGEYSKLHYQYFGKKREHISIHCNTAESFFALIKRGIYGTYHQVSKKHLHRYCDEFAFRWNLRRTPDGNIMTTAIKGFEGKRLKYKTSSDEKPVC